MKARTTLMSLLITVLLLVACTPTSPQSPTKSSPTAAPTGGAGMANPSATFCEEKGYSYEIRTASDGSQSGVCKFPDGTECDGWAFYRGECGPAGQKSTPKGGSDELSSDQETPMATENKAVEAVRAQLAQKLSITSDSLKLLKAEPVDWPDACLGLAAAGEVCATVITPGFRVILQNGDQSFTYHTDLAGSVIRQETAGTAPVQ